MSYGALSPAQAEAIRPYIEGKTVYDLGAGDLQLAKQLLRLGSGHVVAVDKDYPPLPLPDNLSYTMGYIASIKETVEVAFVAWPVNWEVGLATLFSRIGVVIYLGTNTGGSACGNTSMWEHLITREWLVHLPERANTLVVYGPNRVVRPQLREESCALDLETMHFFEEEPCVQTQVK
jgi:hypothetical protein